MANSEEQWERIDECEQCKAPIYAMGDKVKYHDCPYNYTNWWPEVRPTGLIGQKNCYDGSFIGS